MSEAATTLKISKKTISKIAFKYGFESHDVFTRAFTKVYKITFLIESMCRISEFAGLTWDDVDMKAKTVSVNHQLLYKKFNGDNQCTYHIENTKSSNVRILPMTEFMDEVLRELKRYYFILKSDAIVDDKANFIFTNSCKRLLNGTSFNAELKSFVEEFNKTAKNPIQKITPHMLRHTGCTRNAENGMDLKVLQYLMGMQVLKLRTIFIIMLMRNEQEKK